MVDAACSQNVETLRRVAVKMTVFQAPATALIPSA
jgi:hypothetical protein